MHPNLHKLHILLTWCLLGSLTGCGIPDSFQAQSLIPNELWPKGTPISLVVQPNDTLATYQCYLDVRLTASYPYDYIQLQIIPWKRTLLLALQEGVSCRSGLFSDYRFSLDTLDFHLLSCPLYLSFQHQMPKDTLPGVAAIGILFHQINR